MSDNKKSPAVASTTDRARGLSSASRQPHYTTPKLKRHKLTVRFQEALIVVEGRAAQTLLLLKQKGSRGFTSGEASTLGWAKRTSHYIHQLRKLGFQIVTVREKEGDVTIGRYVLMQRVVIVARCGL